MKNSIAYAEYRYKISECEEKLKNLDADYASLQECKSCLSACVALLEDLSTQCGDIKKVFDRGTVEGRYDACKITFDTKETVFEYIENVGNSTSKFDSSCGDLISQLYEYGKVLDDYCKTIATDAAQTKSTLNSLRAQIWKYY